MPVCVAFHCDNSLIYQAKEYEHLLHKKGGLLPLPRTVCAYCGLYARCGIELSSDHDTARSSVPALMSYLAVIKVMLP